jgi:hypothetical protein
MFKKENLKKEYWVCFYCGKKNDLHNSHCLFCRKEKIKNNEINAQLLNKAILIRLFLLIITVFVMVTLITIFRLS